MSKSISRTTLGIALSATLLLSACTQRGDQVFEPIGTVIGAVAGAFFGGKIGEGAGRSAAIAIGTVVGTVVGRQAGRALDEMDLQYMSQTLQDSLDTKADGETSEWSNPESGNSGTVTAGQTYQNDTGEDCRDFENNIIIDGEEEITSGQACRQPDGSWKVVS